MMRPRLLTLTPDFPPSIGGIQLLLERLLARLEDFEHLVVCRAPASASAQPAVLDGLAVLRTRSRRPRAALAELNALGLWEGARFRPDLILNGHVVTTPAALALRSALRVPIVSYVYADEIPVRPALTRLAVRRSFATLAVSAYAAELAREGAGARGRIEVVYPGIDQPEMTPLEPAQSTIVTVARLADRYKGHDVIIDALGLVVREVPGVRWVVVGDGPLRGELEARARERGVAELVHFAGRLSDSERDAVLSRATVLCMPSRLPPGGLGGEGFGIVYLEAGLRGVPSVAGAVGGAVEAVRHESTGLLVDPTSPEDVASALVRLLEDRDLRDRLGRNAREFALEHTWNRMAEQVGGVLREAASFQCAT